MSCLIEAADRVPVTSTSWRWTQIQSADAMARRSHGQFLRDNFRIGVWRTAWFVLLRFPGRPMTPP